MNIVCEIGGSTLKHYFLSRVRDVEAFIYTQLLHLS